VNEEAPGLRLGPARALLVDTLGGVSLCVSAARPVHAAYSNRAACRTKLGSFAAAILDAEWCIALAPAWSKGYARKGLAAGAYTRSR